MGKLLTPKWYIPNDGYLSFFCPGCLDVHMVSIPHEKYPGKQTWGFQFNDNKVTLTPSVKVTNGHYCDRFKPGDNCWCTFYKEPEHMNDVHKFKCGICHSFVVSDVIQFLSDCTHSLANQQIQLPDYPLNMLHEK